MRNEFSSLLQYARKDANLTQKQLADILGVARGTVQQWELGLRFPRLEMLQKIEDTLQIALVPQLTEDAINSACDTLKTIENDKGTQLQMALDGVFHFDSKKDELSFYFEHLNDDGQEIALKNVKVIAGNPTYQRTYTHGSAIIPPDSHPEQPEDEEEVDSPTTEENPPEGL